MMKEMILHFVKYNLWANDRIVNCILEAGEDKADLELVSSFPTIRKTLYHVWDAETIWLKRLHGESIFTWPSKDFKGSLADAAIEMADTDRRFIAFAEAINETALLTVLNYKNTKGDDFSTPIYQMIMHCMNHSTYHRGQLVTMLRTAGFTNVVSTDYVVFCRI